MAVLKKASLAKTIDEINESFFLGRPLTKQDRQSAGAWLASRQALPGSYWGMFAPTPADFEGVKLFTGEALSSHASISHILGQETCRALILLNDPRKTVRDSLSAARKAMANRCLAGSGHPRPGMFCCGQCSVAMWRHLLVSGRADTERRLTAGLRSLKTCRNDTGRWRVFPFYYTLLALSEMDLPAAVREIHHAAPTCEKLLKHKTTNNRYNTRRRILLERVLAKA